jgi:predicted permease
MPWMNEWFRRLRVLAGREQFDRDLEDEMRLHQELRARELAQAGAPSNDARAAARRRFGNATLLREESGDAWGWRWIENLAQDFRYGGRMLLRSPGFSVVAILTLALGVGANTALFSVVNGVLLKPLPYAQPAQLVALHASKPNFPKGSISYPNFLDWQQRNRTFTAMAIYRGTGFNLVVNGEAERVRGEWMTSDLLSLFGVQPVLGRHMKAGEDAIGGPLVAEISEQLWKRKFGGAANVLGSAVVLDGRSFVVIGIVPASFDLLQVNGGPPDVYVPLGQLRTPALKLRAAGLGLHGFGRIKPGVSLVQARQDLDRVTRELGQEFPDIDRGVGATAVPLEEELVGSVRPLLLFLLAAVGFVLLIACVNVASLLLARSAVRSREFAVRSALGASRGRVVRQLLTETTMLALAGGALGCALAAWGTRAALASLPQALPRVQQVRVDVRVLAFTFAISVFCGLLFGLAPALRMAASDLRSSLAARHSAGGRRLRTQRALVVIEVALAVLLLVGAGLMLRSLAALWHEDPGFAPHNVLTFFVDLPAGMRDRPASELRPMWQRVQQTIAETPGVTAASLRSGSFPLAGDDELLFWTPDQPEPPSESEKNWTLRYDVMPDYERVMRLSLLRGRFFTPADETKSPLVAVVDDVFAATFFPGQEVLGKRIRARGVRDPLARPEDTAIVDYQIVGVVGHVKQWGAERDNLPGQLRAQVYTDLNQIKDAQWEYSNGFVMRTSQSPLATFESVQRQLRQVSSELVVYGPLSMDDRIALSLGTRRLAMALLAAFAGAALLLACVGIFGVITYLVRERTQEFGIRMALGAQRSDVLRMVLVQGARMMLAGVASGLAAAVGLTQLMRNLLFGVRPTDPLTYAGVAAILMVVALAACYVPARRATRIDPMVALRYD